jgi:hypothetical protein
MRRVLLVMIAAAALVVGIGWLVAARIPGRIGAGVTSTAPPPPAPTPEETRKLQATLFFVAEDGTHLVGVPREVAFAETTADQARRLVEAQLGPAPSPYAAPLPSGTTVRAVFLTERHEAFVDLSREATTGHTGGSLDELFSVYAIVNALTVNLPAIERVQLLLDGKEVESLAGHVDLRHPLPRNLTWVARPEGEEGASPEKAPAETPATPQTAPGTAPADPPRAPASAAPAGA